MKLRKSQQQLLNEVLPLLPANTHQIAVALGHRQSYESFLRNRLYKLKDAGYLDAEETPYQRIWKIR